ncbi:MAG: autotransporter domain-containing protein [Alphaproteobacteria bacterium]|nr:autotransporter domain-containing protein [Alphaproteobacteria bacterium]
MRNKLLFSTALVAAAFAASNALADNTYKEYEAGSVISADDLGHEAGDNRISFMGDATLEKDVTMGNFVTLQEKTKLDGGKKLTVTGYLTQTAEGSDISGIDLEMKKGEVYPNNNPAGTEGEPVDEGELVLGSDLTVGNVDMTDGTGIFLFKGKDSRNNTTEKSLTIVDGKTLTFADNNYIKGTADTSLKIDGKGTVVNNGNLNIETALESAAKLINNGDILAGDEGLNIALNGGYESDGGYLGNKTLAEGKSTIDIQGNIKLDNNARIVAATTNDQGTVNITNAPNITLTNGSSIDAVTLKIDGGENRTAINISGNNPEAGREGEKDEQWRNNAYILGYGDSNISDADITIGAGGMLIQGATGNGTEEIDKHSMTLTNSYVNVAKDGLMKSTNGSDFALSDTTIDLAGRIEGIVKNAVAAVKFNGDEDQEEAAKGGVINVTSADAYIQQIDSLDELNIKADTSASELLGGNATVTDMNIASGNTFTLDQAEEEPALLTASNMNVDGTLKLADGAEKGTGYAITNTNVNNGGTLDVGTNSYNSNVTMNEGSTLSLTIANGEDGIVNGNINGDGSSLKVAGNSNLQVVISDDADLSKEAKLDLGKISDALTDEAHEKDKKLTLADNFIYDLSVDGKTGEITAVKEDTAGVVANAVNAGASSNAAGTIGAFALVDGLSGQGKAVHDFINTSMQKGDAASAAQLAEDVAPSAAPVVQTVETGIMNQAYGAVSSQLSGGHVASAAQGKSSGDGMFDKAAAWVRTLFNKSELDDTSKAKGFDVETTGVAMGFHKEVAENVKAGVAYAYGDTSVDGHHRDTDVDSHTFMLYGEYKPSDWYVNAIASYGMSDYDESKHTAVGKIKGSYDVETYGLQAMTGYDFNVSGYTLTPEAGLRYAHIKQDSYRDSAGQRISSENQDILTGIAGVKASKDFTLENGMKLRPEARLAMTYDLMDGENDAIVNIGSASYRINGEQLDRFGIEAGAGLTAELNDKWDVSAGYEGKFRDDFNDHTGILSAKYKF